MKRKSPALVLILRNAHVKKFICINLIAPLFFGQVLTAQDIAPDLAAPQNHRPSVDTASNGVPLVNIAAPNSSGVSHNKFTDYNVNQEGVILNNSNGQYLQTQLGGYILSNPNLRGGDTSSLIINEVTGTTPSNIHGTTEVAGDKAAVIVANPNGITLDGANFLNTGRVTMTTGKPEYSPSGQLQLGVYDGDIYVQGNGVDATGADSFDLISRAAHISADIHAKELEVITGRNKVTYADKAVEKLSDDGSDKPEVAIDSSSLGGMYAGQIRLISTEEGVGVNMEGVAQASAGDLFAQAAGKVAASKMRSTGSTTIRAQEVELKEEVYAERQLTIESTRDVVVRDHAVASAEEDVALSSSEGSVKVGTGAQVAAGMLLDGQLASEASLSLQAGSNIQNNGSVIATDQITATADASYTQSGAFVAGKDAQITAGNISLNTGSATGAGADLSLHSTTGNITAAGEISALGTVDATASGNWVQSGEVKSGSSTTLTARDMNLSSTAYLEVATDLTLAASRTILNQGNILIGNDYTAHAGANFGNIGTTTIGGSTSLTAAGDIINTGALHTVGTVDLSSATLNNTGTLTSGATLTSAQSSTAKNSGSLFSSGATTLTSSSLDNSGEIHSIGALTLTLAYDLINSGEIYTEDFSTVTAGAVTLNDNAHLLSHHASTLTTTTGGLTLGLGARLVSGQDALGAIITEQDYDLSIATDIINHGTIASTASLSLDSGGGQYHSGSLFAFGDATLDAGDTIQLASTSTLEAGGNVTLTNAVGSLVADGLLISQGSIIGTTNGDWLQGGDVISGEFITLDARDMSFGRASYLQGASDLTLLASDTILHQGDVLVGGNYNVQAGGDFGNTGFIQAGGDTSLIAVGDLLNTGAIETVEATTLSSSTFNNYGLLSTGADLLSTQSSSALNSGTLFSIGSTGITSHSLDNSGEIQSLDVLNLSITDGLINTGVIYTPAHSSISAGYITLGDNARLLSQHESSLSTHTGGLFLGTGARLVAGQDAVGNTLIGQNYDLSIATDIINHGTIASTGNLTLDSGAGQYHSGNLFTLGDTTLHAGNTIQLASTSALEAGGDVSLTNTAGSLVADGLLVSQGSITGTTNGDWLQGGRVVGSNSATISARDIHLLSTAELELATDLTLTASRDLLNEGLIVSQGTLGVQVAGDFGNSGAILSRGNLTLDSESDLINTGLLSTSADLLIQPVGIFTNHGRTYSGGFTTVKGQAITSTGSILSTADSSLTTAGVLTLSGTYSTEGTSTLTGSTVTIGESAQIIAGKTSSITSTSGNLTIGTGARVAAGQQVNGSFLSDQASTLTSAGSLTNHGTVISSGDLTVSAQTDYTQSGSLITQSLLSLDALGEITLTDSSITKAGSTADLNAGQSLSTLGVIDAFDTLNLTAGGDWHTAGTLIASDDLTAQITGNITSDGTVESYETLSLLSSTGSITLNTGSDLYGTAGVILDAETTLQNRGLLQSADALSLTAHQDVTLSGNTLSIGNLSLTTSGQLLNHALLQSDQDLIINTIGVTNSTSGNLTAFGNLTLNASSGRFSNTGQVNTAGNATLTAASLTNSGSINSESTTTLTATAGNIDLLAGSSLTAADITAHTSRTLTQAGTLEALNSASLTGLQGLLTTGTTNAGSLSYTTNQDWENDSDFYVSGDFSLSARNLTNTSTLASAGDLSLNLTGNLTNSGALFALGSADLRANGNITNTGAIMANDNLSLSAINGGRAGSLTNDLGGVIESWGGDISIKADSFANTTTAPVVNYDVVIEDSATRTVTEDQLVSEAGIASKIRSAGNMTLDFNTGENAYSQIAAGNDLSITGGSLVNQGTALYKDVTLKGTQFYAFWEHLAAKEGGGRYYAERGISLVPSYLDSSNLGVSSAIFSHNHYYLEIPGLDEYIEYQAGWAHENVNNPLSPDEFLALTAHPTGISENLIFYLDGKTTPDDFTNWGNGPIVNNFDHENGDLTTAQFFYAQGGTTSRTIHNYNSTIQAGGSITGDLTGDFVNTSDQLDFNPQTDGFSAPNAPSAVTSEQDVVLSTELGDADLLASNTGNDLSGTTEGLQDELTQETDTPLNTDLGDSALLTTGPLASVLSAIENVSLSPQEELASPAEGVTLNLSQKGQTPSSQPIPVLEDPLSAIGGLSTVTSYTSSPNAPYLIETDSRFTDLGRWLGGDYFLERSGYKDGNPETTVRRLGDAFWESQYISNQIFEETGSRFIGEDISNDFDQMQHLYDNALEAQESLSLSPGIALTPEQFNALNEDIVWMEERIVDGETVLVPQLYLSPNSNHADTGGAQTIAGDSVVINAGRATNSGTISAGNTIDIDSASDLNNSGNMSATHVEIRGERDVNMSGDFTAESVEISSGRDINLEGEVFKVDGDVSIHAEREILIDIIETKIRDFNVTDEYTYSGDWEDGMRFEVGGNLSLSSGGDLTLSGANFNVGGDLSIWTDGDLIVDPTEKTAEKIYYREEIDPVTPMKGKFSWFDWGTGSHSGEYTSETIINNVYEGASFFADNIFIGSGGDSTIIASNFNARGGLEFNVNGSLTFESIENTSHQEVENGKISKGFFGETTNITFTRENDIITSIESTLTSGDFIRISSGSDLVFSGADISATGDLSLWSDENIIIDPSVNSTVINYTSKTNEEINRDKTLNQAVFTAKNIHIGSEGNTSIISAELESRGVLSVLAEGDLDIVSEVESFLYDGSYSSKYYNYHQNSEYVTNVGSVLTGSDLVVLSNGDVTLKGSGISGEESVTVSAAGDVDVKSVQDTSYYYDHERKVRKKSFGRKKVTTTINETATLDAIASEIYSGGDLDISSGEDFLLLGSNLGADGNLSLIHGGDLEILSAREEQEERYERTVRKTMFGFRYGKGRESSQTLRGTLQGSIVGSGQDTSISAENITISASNVGAGGDIDLFANGDIALLTDTESISQRTESEYSGFFTESSASIGGASAGFGYKEESESSSYEATNHVGVNLGAGGRLGIFTGGDGLFDSSSLRGDMGILMDIGGDATFASTINSSDSTYDFDSWSISVDANVSTGILGMAASGIDLLANGGGEAGVTGLLAGGLRAGVVGSRVADTLDALGNGSMLGAVDSLGLSATLAVGFNTQSISSEDHTRTSNVTTLDSDFGDIIMNIGGDGVFTGTQATAGGRIGIDADGNIVLNQALNHSWGESENHSGGITASITISGAGITGGGSGNYAEGSSEYDIGTYIDTAFNSGTGEVDLNALGEIIDNQLSEDWNHQDSSSFGTGNIGFSVSLGEFGDNTAQDASDKNDPERAPRVTPQDSNYGSGFAGIFGEEGAGGFMAGLGNRLFGDEMSVPLFGEDGVSLLNFAKDGLFGHNMDLAGALNVFANSAYSQTLNQLLQNDESELENVWRNGLMSGTQAAGAFGVAHSSFGESLFGGNPITELGVKPWAHGAVQGGIGALFGEDFDAGFRAGVASSYAGGITQALGMGINDSRQLTSNLGQAIAGLNGADPNFGRQIGENVWEYNDMAEAKEALGAALESFGFIKEDPGNYSYYIIDGVIYIMGAGAEVVDSAIDGVTGKDDSGETVGEYVIGLHPLVSAGQIVEELENGGLSKETALQLVIDFILKKIPGGKGKGDEILGAINKRVGANRGGDLVVNPNAPNNGLGKVTGQFDAVNPGSLSDDLAGTFSGGRYNEVVLDADTILYRAGKEGTPLGQFFSTEVPGGILQTRIDKAVLPVWPGGGTSPINAAFGVKIPAGTKVFTGNVGSQGGVFVGGTPQIVVPKPWLIDGVEHISTIPLR